MDFLSKLENNKVTSYIENFFKPGDKVRARDIVREFPQAFRENLAPVADKTAKFLQSSGQFDMRVAGGTANVLIGGINKANAPVRAALGALSKINALAPLAELKDQLYVQPLSPQTQFQKEIFGTDKTLGYTRTGKELRGSIVDKEPEELKTLPIDPILGAVAGFAALTTGGGGTERGAVKLSKDLFARVAAKYGPSIAKKIDALGDAEFATASLVRGTEEYVAHRVNLTTVRMLTTKVVDSLDDLQKTYNKTLQLRKPEIGQRFQAAENALNTEGGGSAGFRAARSQLKGRLPQATPKTQLINSDEVEVLLKHISGVQGMTLGDKLSAEEGLRKAVGDPFFAGHLPAAKEIENLRRVFGEELASAIDGTKQIPKDFIEQIVGLPRAMMASFDFSAPLRQGLFLMADNPKAFTKAFGQQYKYFFNPKYYDAAMDNLKNSPLHSTRLASGLDLTEVSTQAIKLTQQEEAFRTNLLERIPIIRNTISPVVNASERAYVGFLNKLRADIFDESAKQILSMGWDAQRTQKELEGVADFINTASGRGKLSGRFSQAGSLLGSAFFSARLIASRFQLLNPIYYYKLPPTARKMAMRSAVKTLGLLTSMLGFAKMMGADVETDTRSSDFGKIKVGNIRYDIAGGFQQWLVMYSRVISNVSKSISGKKTSLDGRSFPFQTGLDVIENFFENKAAPVPSLMMDLVRRGDSQGNPLNFTSLNPSTNTLLSRLTPFMVQDFLDIAHEEGITEAALKIIPVIHGVGVQVIPQKSSKSNTRGLPTLPQLPSLPSLPGLR